MFPKRMEHSDRPRRPTRWHARGFTLIELVTVVVLLAALSTVAIPVYLEYRDDAKRSTEKAIVASVKTGIRARHARTTIDGADLYPATLDSAAAGSSAAPNNPFFAEVLGTPLNNDWQKGTSANIYVGPTGGSYVYVSSTGAFLSEGEYEAWVSGAGSTEGGGETGGGDGGETGGGETDGGEETSGNWLAGLTPEEMAALTDEQIAALTAEEIASLSYKQFEAIANRLSPDQLAGAAPDQIAMLSSETFGAFSEEQLAALTEAQLAERAVSDQIRSLTNYRDFRSIDPNAAKYLTAEQIRLIPNDYELSQIPAEVRAGFIDVQIQALDTSELSIGYLTAAQRELLTPEQINSLGSYYDLRYVPTSLASHVSTDLIATIPNSYEMSRIPEAVRAAFTAEQVQAVDTSKVSIGYLSASQRELLTTEQIESLASYYDIRYVPESRATEVTAALIASIPNSYEMSRIPDNVRAAFTPEQVQAVDTGVVSIGYLTESQREQLTTDQFQSLGSYYDIRYVPPSRATEVATSLIATIPNNYEMSQIPTGVRSEFSVEQAQALDTSKVSIGYLSEAQREQLTTDQYQSLGSHTDIRYVPPSRAADVSADLIATIPSDYEMGRIPDEVRAAFTTTQVQAVDTTQVSIGYLTETQREQLTTNQLQTLGAYTDIRYVPPSRAADVSTDLIAAIPSDYEMSRIPDEVRAALTASQVQAVDTTQVSIGYLTETQREQLTTNQLQTMDAYTDIRYVPPSRAAEVSANLIAAIPSDYEMSRIPDEVRAALTTSQVQAVDTTQVSIGYLTAGQREELTTSQLQSLGTYADIRHVPASRVSDVTTDLVASIPSNYEMSRIPDEVRAAFTTSQVQAVDTTQLSIGYLTAGQRDQLTTTQIQTLGSSADIRHLSAERVPEVTTSLIAQIPSSYEFTRIPSETVHAMTQAQVLAIPDSFYDSIKSSLTDEQRSWRP